MAAILSDLANYFNLEETNIDNWTFKLYYKVSMVICMTGTTVGIASQYFGDPIRCVITVTVIVIVMYVCIVQYCVLKFIQFYKYRHHTY